MEVFKDFHTNKKINRNMNNAFIALIAKRTECKTPLDFQPISLTTSLYKIIAKVLANSLKTTLSSTIAPNQHAFVKGRQITDAILMANEAVDYWKMKKQKVSFLSWI